MYIYSDIVAGDCVLYAKQVTDSCPGSHSNLMKRVDVFSKYEIKALCYSVQMCKYIPGIDVIASVITI